jgi:hypothetical protein
LYHKHTTILQLPVLRLFPLGNYLLSSINTAVSTFAPHPTISPLSHHLTANQVLPKPLLFLTCNMGDQSRSASFRPLFESALQAYEKKTDISLAEHPLTVQLQSCNSVESVTAVLRGQAQPFCEFSGSDRILRSIKKTALILVTLSSTASLGDALGLVRRKTLIVCSTVLTVLRSLSHLRRQYRLALLSCFRYVLCVWSVDMVTCERTRRRAAYPPVTIPLSTFSSRSNTFSVVLIYIHGSLLRPQWTRWL